MMSRQVTSCVPAWAGSLGTAVWVTDPDRTLRYVNDRAKKLLRGAEAGIGCPCHEVVRGRGEHGEPVCRSRCRVARLAGEGAEIEPQTFRVDGPNGPEWIQVLVIPVTAPDGSGPWLVHCASRRTREQRATNYLRKVARRNQDDGDEAPASPSCLTPREAEILHRLAEDEDLFEIARNLHVSHSTVRNHVQRIMAKLEVHSMLEAVAVYLLGTGDVS